LSYLRKLKKFYNPLPQYTLLVIKAKIEFLKLSFRHQVLKLKNVI